MYLKNQIRSIKVNLGDKTTIFEGRSGLKGAPSDQLDPKLGCKTEPRGFQNRSENQYCFWRALAMNLNRSSFRSLRPKWRLAGNGARFLEPKWVQNGAKNRAK